MQIIDLLDVKKCLGMLVASFGLKIPFDPEAAEEFFYCRQYGRCIGEIKRHFGIGLTLRVQHIRDQREGIWFPRDFPIDSLLISRYYDEKREPALVGTNDSLRLFGTKAFENSTLMLYLHPTAKEGSFEQFAAVIGHQMAHILLHATFHPLRRSEVATDLLAMVMGFHAIIHGANIQSSGKIGYLHEDVCSFAFGLINKRLGEKVISVDLAE
jgi:hypothetical protein